MLSGKPLGDDVMPDTLADEAFSLLTGLIAVLQAKGVVSAAEIDALLERQASDATPMLRAYQSLRKSKAEKP